MKPSGHVCIVCGGPLWAHVLSARQLVDHDFTCNHCRGEASWQMRRWLVPTAIGVNVEYIINHVRQQAGLSS